MTIHDPETHHVFFIDKQGTRQTQQLDLAHTIINTKFYNKSRQQFNHSKQNSTTNTHTPEKHAIQKQNKKLQLDLVHSIINRKAMNLKLPEHTHHVLSNIGLNLQVQLQYS